MMKWISIVAGLLFISACSTSAPSSSDTSNQGSKIELYGIIDSGIGVQRSSQ